MAKFVFEYRDRSRVIHKVILKRQKHKYVHTFCLVPHTQKNPGGTLV